MKEPNPLQVILFFVLFAPGIYLLYIWAVGTGPGAYLWAGIIAAIIALLIAGSIKIADQWEKARRTQTRTFYRPPGPGTFLHRAFRRKSGILDRSPCDNDLVPC